MIAHGAGAVGTTPTPVPSRTFPTFEFDACGIAKLPDFFLRFGLMQASFSVISMPARYSDTAVENWWSWTINTTPPCKKCSDSSALHKLPLPPLPTGSAFFSAMRFLLHSKLSLISVASLTALLLLLALVDFRLVLLPRPQSRPEMSADCEPSCDRSSIQV